MAEIHIGNVTKNTMKTFKKNLKILNLKLTLFVLVNNLKEFHVFKICLNIFYRIFIPVKLLKAKKYI